MSSSPESTLFAVLFSDIASTLRRRCINVMCLLGGFLATRVHVVVGFVVVLCTVCVTSLLIYVLNKGSNILFTLVCHALKGCCIQRYVPFIIRPIVLREKKPFS